MKGGVAAMNGGHHRFEGAIVAQAGAVAASETAISTGQCRVRRYMSGESRSRSCARSNETHRRRLDAARFAGSEQTGAAWLAQ
jgi:hypothetical protein